MSEITDKQKELSGRINQYLSVGGFFNPEQMEHEKVRDLLMECREFLDLLPEPTTEPVAWLCKKGLWEYVTRDKISAQEYHECECEVTPLYAAPQEPQMTEEKAREVLGDWIAGDGSIREPEEHRVNWDKGDIAAYIEEGHFTADQLEAVAFWIRNKSSLSEKDN